MWYRLSREMGIPVSELTDRVNSVEFLFYAASYQLHPAIGDLLDMQTAYICTMLSAAHGGSARFEDFYPDRFSDPTNEWEAFQLRMDSLVAMQKNQGEITREKQ